MREAFLVNNPSQRWGSSLGNAMRESQLAGSAIVFGRCRDFLVLSSLYLKASLTSTA